LRSLDAVLHCPHFGRCGGCSLLDQPIADQLAQKQRHAATLLGPWLDGVVPETSLPPRPPRHDRTTILYPAQLVHRQLQLGIYRRGSHDVEPITDCRIQHKALTTFGVRAGDVLRDLKLPVYLESSGNGLVRAVRARVMAGSRELLVGLVTTRAQFSEREALARAFHAAASDLRDDQGQPLQLVGVVLNVNDRPGNALLGPHTIALRGQAHQTDRQAGLSFRVSFGSFYQLSRHAEAILFKPALAMLGDVQGLRIVDGYAGVGTFALRLLRAGAAHVTLVESAPSSCADARINLDANGMQDRATVREEAFGLSPLPACDLLLADPPRAGLLEVGALAILAAAPPRVLLVSCSLDALARDLAALAGRYRVRQLRLCDLFPHTEHVEALTLLERRA
jgi:23S rRNA (uracil1939-C5)-methyltransferase